MRIYIRMICLILVGLFPGTASGSDLISELVGGARIPIPSAMTKATDQQLEMMIPGFQGGQIAYRGSVEPKEIVAFYQSQMRDQGWTLYASFVSEQGLLVFTKAHQSALIMVSESEGTTTLAILVGSMPPQ